MKLLDELVIEPNGSFTLLGRQADLVKIAGRRASLAGLNLLLQDMPGLEDGVFYLPSTSNPTERLCLIYAGAPLDRAATRRWLRTRLDPVFLPRDFILLDRLPRGENASSVDIRLTSPMHAGNPRRSHGEVFRRLPRTIGPRYRERTSAYSAPIQAGPSPIDELVEGQGGAW